ncbi:MAG: AIR synthase-related protein, partial [Elioraea tepidiphila]
DGLVAACHDVSDGGLLVALADMAVASGMGLSLDWSPHDVPAHAFWFGEDQGRYVLAVSDGRSALAETEAAGVPAVALGRAEGTGLTLTGAFSISVERLRQVHASWLPAYMA